MDEKIYFTKDIYNDQGQHKYTLFIQHQKIIITRPNRYGLMLFFKLQECSSMQFKGGMYSTGYDIYKIYKDEYKNWWLLNTSEKIKYKSVKILSVLEAMVVNKILQRLELA